MSILQHFNRLRIIQAGITPVLLKPIMTNFRVYKEAAYDRVYFDTPLGSVVGIDYTDFTIEGKTISAVNTSSNYFTLSADLNYYDNILIRKEGGNNSVVYDFTLEYIENIIPEPSTSNPDKYVAVTPIGLQDGSSEANAMSLSAAFSQATQNTTYWVKAGNYGAGPFVIGGSGTLTEPVKFVGYKSIPGDAISLNRQNLFDNVDSFDSAEMPLITGGTGNGSIDSGNNDYIILRNFQVSNFTDTGGVGAGIYLNNARFFIVDNCYLTEIDNHSIYAKDDNSGYNRVINSYASNSKMGGVELNNEHNLIKNTWAVSNYVVGMDYMLTIYGGLSGVSNCIKDCYINQEPTDTKTSHGYSFKADQYDYGTVDATNVSYSLIVDCISDNSIIEVRHRSCQYNVFRNIDIDGSGIVIRDGASYNTLENIKVENATYFLRMWETDEDNEGAGIPNENPHHNIFKNCIGDNLDLLLQTSDLEVNMLPDIDDNHWYNCTFKDIAEIWENKEGTTNVLLNPTNTFENCIMDRTGYNGIGQSGSEARMNPTIVNTDLWDSYWTASGSNVNIDPQLDANYQPQATFADIDASLISGVYYDKNGDERVNPTTMGAVKSVEEIVGPVVDNPILQSAVVENSNPNNVVLTFNESVAGTNLGFSLLGTTSSGFSSLSGSGAVWNGVLADPIQFGEVVTLSYDEATGDIEDLSGNPLLDVSNFVVQNDVDPVGFTNYVFDGGLTSFMADESAPATLLDGIVAQTWIVRMKLDALDVQHGVIGCTNSATALKMEIDADDNRMDLQLADTGVITDTNGPISVDLAWHTIAWTTTGVLSDLYEDGVNIDSRTDGTFTGRTPGRPLAIGAAVIGGGAPGYLIGKISDAQFYNRELTAAEVIDLSNDITDVKSGIVANFAGQKTETEWTSEIGGYVLTNQGGVTTE